MQRTVQCIVSFALVLLLMVAVILGAKYQNISLTVQNLMQLYNGSFGDYFALAVFVFTLLSALGRAFHRWFQLQEFVKKKLFSPVYVTGASLSLLLMSGPAAASFHHQYLVLFTFLLGMFLRFSGSCLMPEEMSTNCRILSRVVEMVLFMSFPNLTEIWCWQTMVPCAVIVSLCRTNEVFGPWRSQNCEIRCDQEQAREGFVQLDELVMPMLLQRVKDIPWPNTAAGAAGANAPSYYGYPNDRLRELKLRLQESGLYRHLLNVPNQYAFLWVEGSGMLVCACMIVLSQAVVCAYTTDKSTDSVVWRVSVTLVSMIICLYLIMQCLPGLIVRLNKAQELLNLALSLKDWIKSIWSAQTQNSWFTDIVSFARVLMFGGGIPLRVDPIFRVGSWKLDTKQVEGFELTVHVTVCILARALVWGLLLCAALALRVTRLSVVACRIWGKCNLPLACFAANLSVPDIVTAKTCIAYAESALDSRKLCTGCQGQICTTTVNVDVLLGYLEDDALAGYEHTLPNPRPPPPSADLRRRAFLLGLFKSTQMALEDVTEEGAQEIASRLHSMHRILKPFYVAAIPDDRREVVTALADQVVSWLQQYCNTRWDQYAGLGQHCRCVSEADWKLMKAQLQAAMLMFTLERPEGSSAMLSVTGLYDWMEIRKGVPGIKDCDVIT